MATIYEICEAKAVAEEETWFTLDALGISEPVLTYVIAGVDTLQFTITNQGAFTDDYFDVSFDHNAHIRLRRVVDGAPELLFLGRIRSAPRMIDGSTEAYTITMRGMWDWLENAPMRQSWTEPNSSTVTKPRVILFCNGSGGRMTTGQQIAQCVAAARSAGCPIADPVAGDIDNGWSPPYDEQINITIANALAKCLANHPHASIWFDYSTREPVMRCKTRASLAAVSYDIAGRKDITVIPRPDLQPPAIAICYEKEFQDDGASGVITTIDYAPKVIGETSPETNTRLSQVDVVWGVFDLQGSSRTTVSQEIEVEELAETPSAKAWWKAKRPWLADYTDADITLSNAQRHGTLGLAAILTKGALQKWMSKDFEQERFTVDAVVIDRDAASAIIGKRRETLSITLPMTDAVSKTYKTTTSIDSGESIPEGIAASMWAEWQQLHHDGQLTLSEEEPLITARPGKVLNLTNGRAAWATMNAMIKRVTINFDDGTTSIEFGVPGWLDLDSRVAWYRACRTRRYSMSRSLRDGTNDGDGGVEQTNTIRDGETRDVIIRQRQFDPDATYKHELDLDAQAFAFNTEAHGNTLRVIKPREVYQPYRDGTATKAKLAQVLSSELYGDPIDLGGGRPSDPSTPKALGATSETDLAAQAAYNPSTPDAGKDGVALVVSLGSFYDHTAGTPVLKDFRVTLTWPNSLAPKISSVTAVEIDTPQ